MSHELKIGELAERCGVSRDALRFYERVGLLRPPRRTPSGHRVYDQDAVQRLELIRRSQQIGLTLDDIRELLRVQGLPGDEARERVAERLRARIETVDQQLATSGTFHRKLAEALELCESAPAESESFSLLDLLTRVSESAAGPGH
ncbi:MAG TPA: MerR family transcriptional regulator [Thermoanaerobaculia bacterium]|jgi:DNA-binding transcriptional MerR regulator|nr:MerR family transcriptional regulator [Thermoanaerobaculia bacterium]